MTRRRSSVALPAAATLPTTVTADVWLDAGAAAEALGVRRATLYAYVSRGLLSAHADAHGSRYHRDEVERLARQRHGARRAGLAARHTLDFGLPVLSSGLTLIANGQLYYRGREATTLAGSASLEEAAAWLWAGLAGDAAAGAHGEPAAPDLVDPAIAPSEGLAWPLAGGTSAGSSDARSIATRAISALAAWEDRAPSEAPGGLAGPGTAAALRLLRRMLGALLGGAPAAVPAHRHLQQVWRLGDAATEEVRRALVLCADHELNASSFTARCVASTGASLSVALCAGLAALSGSAHGGMTDRVEAWWDEADAAGGIVAWCAGRSGTPASGPAAVLPGFGHPLYPGGDPRAAALLAALLPDDDLSAVLRALTAWGQPPPTIDFALVTLRRRLGLPRGAAFVLFAAGRTVGWLAHAGEQRRQGQLIRPRATYVGPTVLENDSTERFPTASWHPK